MHMAIGAVVNAAWDLAAKRAGKPVWQFLAEMPPEDLVALVDFRYLTDALTPEESLDILRRAEPGRAERAIALRANGYPAYTTTPGWLGYSDEKLQRLAREAVADGFTQIKLKVGADVDEDAHRMRLAREVVGPDIRIAVDANQRWDVGAAVEWIGRLAACDPYWIEEPTSPDDILGHAAYPPGGVSHQGRHRRARRQPGRLQTTAPGRRGGRGADRRGAGRRHQREHRDPAAGRQVRGAGLSRTQAASDSARWCSTWRCSTT